MVPYGESPHDRKLLRACADGSPVALQELADRYYTDIYRVLHTHLSRYLYPREALENMTLDCLGKVCESTERIIDKFGDLDMRMAVTGELEASVEERLITDQRAEAVRRAVYELPQPYCAIFTLLLERELSLADVARELNLSINGIYTQYNRGLELLRRKLGGA